MAAGAPTTIVMLAGGSINELLEKEFLGCRAGAATESRPYRAFHCFGVAPPAPLQTPPSLQPARPRTCNLQRATCNVQLATNDWLALAVPL
jgi:hypothetical protein